jgi:hypothetical protein
MSKATSADDEQRANIGLQYIIQKDEEYLKRNRNKYDDAQQCRNWLKHGYCSYGSNCKYYHI